MTPAEVDRMLRPLPLKDLRLLCRGRGLNPAGGKEQLEDRLKQHMMSTGNFSIQVPAEGAAAQQSGVPAGYAVAPQGYQQYTTGVNNNNYSRPGGQQNVGNFITDRPSSHVTAPPGGYSSVQLGGYQEAPPPSQYQQPPPVHAPYGSPMQSAPTYGATSTDVRGGALANNYSRPGGQQNVGNFITDRPTSRVLAPPGGSSQISFGDYNPPGAYNPPPAHAPASYGSPAPAPYAMAQNQGQPGYGYGSPGMVAMGPDGRPITAGTKTNEAAHGRLANNYSRPGGQQNVGNFITDRPSSKVLAPPGGKSQISFG